MSLPEPYYSDGQGIVLYHGDAWKVLGELEAESVQTCITSPPYWGLRDYGVRGQIGMEASPNAYVNIIVEIFREVRRVLKPDGTLWLNLGDSYAGSMKGIGSDGTAYGGPKQQTNAGSIGIQERPPKADTIGLKPKDLIGIPWRVAFALQADGWWLRSDIIWSKPNPMPESVTDRPTKAHEYLFLLAKSERYYYDADAIAERPAPSSFARLGQDIEGQQGSARANGGAKTNGPMKAVFGGRNKAEGYGTRRHSGREDEGNYLVNGVNKRTVWTIPTQSYAEAHFATFPPKLIEPCVLAGSKAGDTVLDCFHGAGTTGMVSKQLNRRYVGIELNPDYLELSLQRIKQEVLPLG